MASPATNFFNKYYGKQVKFWASTVKNSFECTDLAAVYNEEVVGGGRVSDGNGAKDWWNNYPKNAYTRIPNTATFMPIRGDIVVWGDGLGNGWGHIGIATGENTDLNKFNSFDQNWGGQFAHSVTHSYLQGFLGVLRPNKDVNFDQEAFIAAENDRIARENAQKAADAAQKVEAKRLADEQAKIVAEQAKLEAERLAKIEADKKAEEERLAQEEAQRIKDAQETSTQVTEPNKEDNMSNKFSLNKEDLLKIGKGALIALSGALGAYILSILNLVDAGVYTPLLVAGLSIVANALVKFASGK